MFEKKYSDADNDKILELHNAGTSNKDIAKQFNTNPSNISQRIYLLKKKDKKAKRQSKSRQKSSSSSITSEISAEPSEISASEAPLHPEAEAARREYLNNPDTSASSQSDIIKDSPQSQVEISQQPNETQIEQPSIQVNWSGVSDTLTTILDKRFEANGLAKITDDEKVLFSSALNEVMKNRLELFLKYADIINLGLAGFVVLTPRIFEFLDLKRKREQQQSSESSVDLTKTSISTSTSPVQPADEKAEADRRYQEALSSGAKPL